MDRYPESGRLSEASTDECVRLSSRLTVPRSSETTDSSWRLPVSCALERQKLLLSSRANKKSAHVVLERALHRHVFGLPSEADVEDENVDLLDCHHQMKT
mmetsp:Transcript_2213/g.6309  ORF Transcript_2213/g.6309 Transcript_2213/m.6309 type:complete len:100 (+) Transcript_2213:37-336(+)